jgi:hypothetical protein
MLLGALAMVWHKYTKICLVGDEDFDLSAFDKSIYTEETFFNTDTSKPFDQLSTKRNIEKVLIEPCFCPESKKDQFANCRKKATKPRLYLPKGATISFEFSFKVEIKDVIIDGSKMVSIADETGCTDFCDYCPITSTSGSKTLDDQDQEITTPFGTNCEETFGTMNLFLVYGEGSLIITNVTFT